MTTRNLKPGKVARQLLEGLDWTTFYLTITEWNEDSKNSNSGRNLSPKRSIRTFGGPWRNRSGEQNRA
ncbi:hypothetical protein RB195_020506 [Necator americanus]|uniref:Uncharacterized protein n=1 Tax=Necator americanus TaxID=51031 RepID=A0ABR1CKL5_NECAM